MTVLDMPVAEITAPASNAGFPLADAPLPYWQDRPCPSWCMMTVPHRDHELFDDRLHMGASREIVMTLEAQPTDEFGPGGPANLIVGLWQHYREYAPHITLIVNSRRDINFTLSEARELAAVLEATGYQAGKFWEARPETARPYWQNLPCPGWCTWTHEEDIDPQGRFHASDYAMVTLTMEKPDVSVQPGPKDTQHPAPIITEPVLIGVRLEQGYREYEARVSIVVYDEYYDLTLTEGAELAEALGEIVREAAEGGAQ
jgi:hypothetical protein